MIIIKNYGKEYIDRGMVKWHGMYLSEHTEARYNQQTAKLNRPKQKTAMTTQEIQTILVEAYKNSCIVAIQKEERNLDGDYLPDIVGNILGFDELGLFIDQQKVDFDEIRHVELLSNAKWFEIHL